MRSTSSSLIFENSTRNKKLSMRLSESITLFSFIAPLGSVWAFLLFFSYSNRAASKFFWLILLSHTSSEARSHKDQQTENEIMIMTLHCTSDASQKTCGAISLAWSSLIRHRSSLSLTLPTFKSNQKEMTIRNHAMHGNEKIWLKFTIFSFQLFSKKFSPTRSHDWEVWEGF